MRLAVLLVGVALGASAGATPRAGKVVKVERRSRGPNGVPRYCEVKDEGIGPVGTCLGPQPAIGSVIELLDDSRVFAQVKITDASAYQNCKGIWNIKGTVQHGDLAPIATGRAIGLIDAGLDRRIAHRISDDVARATPMGHADERILMAVDAEGKGNEDLVLTQYVCDAQGQPSAIGGASCFDMYHRVGERLTRGQQTIISGCI
ncbi:MAG: hypothetical protein JWO36_4605 [Myxococcales bacterium]|nr:hypothetical protein [Myxococcales bacterium]